MKKLLPIITMITLIAIVIVACKDNFNESDFLKLQSTLKTQQDTAKLNQQIKALNDAGKLLSFVGGTPETVERLTPVLRAYSADIVHTGGVGTAQVAKAVNNLIMWACLVADHEGLALAQRHGVDVEALRRALLISSATNGALENWGNQTMAWAQDDMAIVAEMADDCGISLPQAGVVREVCRTLKPRRYKLDDYGR